jgi:DNA-binding beta-propeller fold protein YncE
MGHGAIGWGAACAVLLAICLAGCSNSESTTGDGHALDPRLTLTGTCETSKSDSAPDPGCPYAEGRGPRPLSDVCGVATDSLGYIYAASSGAFEKEEGRIAVFDPEGRFLTELDAPERPCRIDVDSRGRVYVAARPLTEPVRYATLRYTPSSYPPTAQTEYGSPIRFAEGGEHYGVAVDPTNDHVYIAKSGPAGIAEYNPDGSLADGAEEVQRVSVDAEGGEFALTFTSEFGRATTGPIRHGASSKEVQAALGRLPVVGPTSVRVSGGAGPGADRPYEVTFTNALAGLDIEPMKGDAAGLRGGAERVEVETLEEGDPGFTGSGYDVDVRHDGDSHDIYLAITIGEKQAIRVYDAQSHEVKATIRKASDEFAYPSSPIAVDQASGDVYVTDYEKGRINQFSASGELIGTINHDFKLVNDGADIAVDGSAESPNQGVVFSSSGEFEPAHLFAFAPQGD